MAPPPADGARCAVATCGDWQLLPVRCAACDALHCTAHAAPHAHACAAAAKPRRTGRPRAGASSSSGGGGVALLPPRNTPASAVPLASTPGDTLPVVVYLPLATAEAPLHAALPLRATVGVALDGPDRKSVV